METSCFSPDVARVGQFFANVNRSVEDFWIADFGTVLRHLNRFYFVYRLRSKKAKFKVKAKDFYPQIFAD
jgi:hypothetical protein